MNKPDIDRVLIAGAGPTGMVAACYLAAEGIPVTVVEAADSVQKDLRASTFHPPTLEMLERFGATQHCIDAGLICPLWQFRDRHSGPVATFDLTLLADVTPHPYRVQCEQWRLNLYLREHLQQYPHAEIRHDCRSVSVSQNNNSVALTVATNGTEEILQGRYLIGSDGASSAVRKSLGIDFEGMTIPETYLTLSTPFQFQDVLPDLADVAYLSDPEEWVVLLRTRRFWRVLVPTTEGTDEQITNPERVQERLQSVVARDVPYEVVHRTAYRVHERVAADYVAGRVFLAGDAAHINNPLGGMGMNGSIHDAINLCEKLTALWRDPSIGLNSMQRYNRQRRKVAIDTVQAQALRNRQILNETDPAKRQAYYDDLKRVVDDPEKHRQYLMRSSMLQSLRDLESID
ncbi:FAD-binding protein [Chromatiales bacterium (ex Bugula neritina AB1)]|nr:FAD-binding protein [Chromatiales bacterium (ex Bugula neritina AB1)]